MYHPLPAPVKRFVLLLFPVTRKREALPLGHDDFRRFFLNFRARRVLRA